MFCKQIFVFSCHIPRQIYLELNKFYYDYLNYSFIKKTLVSFNKLGCAESISNDELEIVFQKPFFFKNFLFNKK